MELTQADLAWISRLPTPNRLDHGTIATLRNMRRRSENASDQRLLDSLLVHAEEIVDEPRRARARLDQLDQILDSPATRRIPAQVQVGAQRLAEHTSRLTLQKRLDELPRGHGAHEQIERRNAEHKLNLEVQREKEAKARQLQREWSDRSEANLKKMRDEQKNLRRYLAGAGVGA